MKEKDLEMEEFLRSLEEFCAGEEDRPVYAVCPALGRYHVIRSSEDERAMIHWNKPEFEEGCGRWFERCGCGFSSWRDLESFQEADDIDMYRLRKKYPDICVRESYCEMAYGKEQGIMKRVSYILVERWGKRSRSFSFQLSDIAKDKVEAWEVAVESWHATGELKTAHFSSDSMHWAWRDN